MICKQRFDITFIPSVSDLDRESYELFTNQSIPPRAPQFNYKPVYKCWEFGYNLMTELYKSYSSPWGRGDVVDPFPGADAQGAQKGTFSRLSAWMAAATSQ